MDWQGTLQSIRQFSLPHTRALRQELDALRLEHAQVSAELEQVRSESARVREHDHRVISDLQVQVSHIELDRDHARKQAQLLDSTLQQANQRMQQTEQRLRALEQQLDDARHQHESNLYLSRDVLQRMQAEQQNLLSVQSDMSRSFQEIGHELLKSLHDQVRPRMSPLQLTVIAGLLFLSGALASVLVLSGGRDYQQNLAAISKGIGELQLLMQAHFRTHEQLLDQLSKALQQGHPLPVPDSGLLTPPVPGSDGHAQRPAMPGVQPQDQGRGNEPDSHVRELLQPETLSPEQVGNKQVRSDLQVLGLLPAGKKVMKIPAGDAEHALRQYLALYRQHAAPDVEQEQLLHDFAVLARADAAKYQVDSRVVAAIRLASLRTGVAFSYLMELASIESSFNPQARAKTSTASGLYQFKDESWLDAVKQYGDRYQLGELAAAIEYVEDAQGILQPRIADADKLQRTLDLRLDPHYAALLAAEQVRDSRDRLEGTLSRKPGRTDLYLTHFFGTSGAISFLQALEKNPDQIAGDIFPGPASRNSNIFHKRDRQPRTVAEIYHLLERKFNTDRYEEG